MLVGSGDDLSSSNGSVESAGVELGCWQVEDLLFVLVYSAATGYRTLEELERPVARKWPLIHSLIGHPHEHSRPHRKHEPIDSTVVSAFPQTKESHAYFDMRK